jgi:hypothetical protein
MKSLESLSEIHQTFSFKKGIVVAMNGGVVVVVIVVVVVLGVVCLFVDVPRKL